MRFVIALALLASCEQPDTASWTYIHTAIIAPSCATASCHSKVTSLAGLDLSTREGSYFFFVGHACGGVPPGATAAPGNYVLPYAPERSELMYRLRGSETRVMPPDQPLGGGEIDLIERWILEGARCD